MGVVVIGCDPGCTTAIVAVEDENSILHCIGCSLAIEEAGAKAWNTLQRAWWHRAVVARILADLINATNGREPDGWAKRVVAVAVESPIERQNRKTLGLQWAMAEAAADALSVKATGYPQILVVMPAMVKRAVTGRSLATKKSMVLMARVVMPGLEESEGWKRATQAQREHLADACGVALAGMAMLKTARIKGGV